MAWLPLISRLECEERNSERYYWKSLEKTLCTFAKAKDTCHGDSGGPLMKLDTDDRLVLVGLTSWGPSPCANGKEAGVYVSVADHLLWIQENIQQECSGWKGCRTASASPVVSPVLAFSVLQLLLHFI